MGILLPFQNKEQHMIKALRKSDPKAQRQVYELYANRMMTLCYRYVNDVMAAEDVLVEGFLKVFQKIDQFSGEGSFENWIKRIMVNESLAYLRKYKYLTLHSDVEAHPYLCSEIEDAVNNLNAEDLLNMIKELSTGYRTVFNLYAIEGYSHQEIATMLCISESTSKSQLHRARILLQKKLREYVPQIN